MIRILYHFRHFTFFEASGMSPLTGDHDVVVRLVPEVVSKRRLVLLAGWPGPHRFERLTVQQEEASLAVPFALAVPHGGDHDVAIRQAVGGVGAANTLSVNLPWLNHLVDKIVELLNDFF